MRQYQWLRNTMRNKFKKSFIGKVLLNMRKEQIPSICFVSATRLDEKDFWSKSLLGRSLKPRLNHTSITAVIAYSNTQGLPEIYNNAIRSAKADIIVFLHDDLWLEDTQLIQKIRTSLKYNDIVGVAGNTRRIQGQPAWLFLRDSAGNLALDREHLSGAIKHGNPGQYQISIFGPSPAPCELMDGVFLAAKRELLIKSNVSFDEKFIFDFYDMDFCRTARTSGLSLSTWPIDMIHLSSGVFGNEKWAAMEKVYFKKWRS